MKASVLYYSVLLKSVYGYDLIHWVKLINSGVSGICNEKDVQKKKNSNSLSLSFMSFCFFHNH